MKIIEIKAIPLRWESPRMGDALIDVKARQALLVRVVTDKGLEGIGEAFLYGCSLRAGKALLEDHLAPALIGEDPTRIEWIWQKLFWRTVAHGRRGLIMGLMSGVDIALWDILGKAAGMPVYKLLGGYADRVPSYASCGFYAPGKGLDGLRREVERNLQKGYRHVKIKAGRTPKMPGHPLRCMPCTEYGVSVEEDLERMAAARALVKEGRLLVDLNAAWSSGTIVHYGRDLARCGVDWLEEPTLFEDLEGCARLRRQLRGILVMGFETEQGVMNYGRLLEQGAVDILQPDIGWSGGITECRKIAALGAAQNKPVSMHSFGSAVHFAASLHLAASLPNTEIIESETNENGLRSELLARPLEADGEMSFFVPEGPGLGITLSEAALERMYTAL